MLGHKSSVKRVRAVLEDAGKVRRFISKWKKDHESFIADQMRLHRVLSGEDDAMGRRVDILADDESLGRRAELAQAEAGREALTQTRCVQAAGEGPSRKSLKDWTK